MTRKDFQLIANAFRSSYDPAYVDQWTHDLTAMARALQTTNPRFDPSRFLAAARPEASTNKDRPEVLISGAIEELRDTFGESLGEGVEPYQVQDVVMHYFETHGVEEVDAYDLFVTVLDVRTTHVR